MEKNRTPIVLMLSGLILIGISVYYSSSPQNNSQIANNASQNSNIQTVTHSPTTAPITNPFFQQTAAPQQNGIIVAKTTPIPFLQLPVTQPNPTSHIQITPQPTMGNSIQSDSLASIITDEYDFYYPSSYVQSTFNDGQGGIQYGKAGLGDITLSKKRIADFEEDLTDEICKSFVQDSTILDVSVIEADFLECHITAKNGSLIKQYRILNTFEDEQILLYYVYISYPENSTENNISLLQQSLSKFELF